MSQASTGKVHSLSPDATPPPPTSPPTPPRRRPLLRRLRWPLLLVAAAAVVLALRLTVFAPELLAVDAARVDYGVVEDTISNTRAGTVKARTRAALSPQVAGRVNRIPYREGAFVDQGAILLELDSSIQRAQLEVAAEDLRVAEARAEEACQSAELASRELARTTELANRGIASAQLLDTRESERDRSASSCRAATAAVGQARAGRRMAAAELALTTIRAPFSGVVAELNTEIGEWVTPSPPGITIPPVIDFLDPSSLFVTAPIDEMDAERVAVGQKLRISVDSQRGQSFPGTVARVAPYVLDSLEQNRTVEIEAVFDDPAAAATMLPGTSADVEVVVEQHSGVLSIPSTAIGQGHTVLIVVNGRLEERQITPGLANWRTTEVVDGVREGELVVVSRNREAIAAGAEVTVREIS